MRVGLSGRLTQIFIRSPLTPLFLLACLAVGFMALAALPREEEPQISVPMVDIIVSANGYKADDAVELITRPLEEIVKGIDDVEHVYSQSEDDRVVATVRFFVGTDKDTAILRVHEKIRANIRDLPTGIPEPLIVGRGIDDVAIVTLTLTPNKESAARWNDNALYQIARELQYELNKADKVGLNYIVGGAPNQIRIEPDPERLSQYGITLNQLTDKLTNANRSFQTGALAELDKLTPVVAGQTLQGVPDIGLLLLTSRDGRPVYLKDVAQIIVGGAEMSSRVWSMQRDTGKDGLLTTPAVTLAFAKQKGANAVTVAHDILGRLEVAKKNLVPADLEVIVTRNYGETATEKSDELIFHLVLATLSIVALITWAIGWREGVVVFVVIPVTILMTLFAAWMMGYTINRVSLFALIFSIGILVDDAIVIVENIVRRWHLDKGANIINTAIDAVSEVGNPTIVATLTIMTALLPMMFVSGLMGPYMSPIPANASMAMLFSFFVAEIITPWLLLKISGRTFIEGDGHDEHQDSKMTRLLRRALDKIMLSRQTAKRFILYVAAATMVACLFFPLKLVVVKLLPFDNKSELQIVLDMPKQSTLEATDRTLQTVADKIKDLPELTSIQSYAGTAMPFNFNGLVRHYYLRGNPEQGELQINLAPKHDRSRTSHEIALDVRAKIKDVALPEGATLKVVEVPPGPPVLATLLAEIYGPDAQTRRETAQKVKEAFAQSDFITDIDDSFRTQGERLRFAINQENLEFYGVDEQAVYDTLAAITGGVKLGYSQKGGGTKPIDITMQMPKSDLWLGERILSTPVPAGGTKREGKNIELGDVVTITKEPTSYPVFRRDGRFAEMVTGELAGRYEAPIYGMLAVNSALNDMTWRDGQEPEILYHGQPLDESKPSVLWDGEWEVTYVTFRDMGAAFIVALLGIYLLVVGLFKSFTLPLVVMVPVPLTLIGIVFGHVLFGAPFTATSMIGFIALAGIIVRNSILLVDFVRSQRKQGMPLREAVIEACMIRVRPIVLTAAAAMIGAAFILADPIFQGLAISLVFGLASSTALTLLVIPALYIWKRGEG